MFSFLFNDTATTQIYPYRHTLSLPDALPISALYRGVVLTIHHSAAVTPRSTVRSSSHFRRKIVPRNRWRSTSPVSPIEASAYARSEEHTSELQSLMRISYAVFCLKKKKKTIH